jgi:hypothetical protein
MKRFFTSGLVLFCFIGNSQIPTIGLLANYVFCGSANDMSGNGNHGQAHGAVLSTDRFGRTGNAYYFNGVSDYVEMPASTFTSLNIYSYSIWLKPVTSNVSVPYSIGSNDPYCQSLSFNTNSVSAGSYNQGTNPVQSYVFSNTMSLVNNWVHVVVTRDMTSIKMYVNGAQVPALSSALTNSQAASYGSTPPYKAILGARSTLSQYFFAGYLDDVRIYSTVLSQSDVNALYNETVTAMSVNSGTVCDNGTFTLNPSGAANYTFSSGTPFVSPLISTTYTVSGQAYDGCTVSAVSQVSVLPSPVVAINSKTTLCKGESATLTASGATSYLWNTGGSTPVINITPTGSIVSYSVTGTSNAGCKSSAQILIEVKDCTGLDQYQLSAYYISRDANTGEIWLHVPAFTGKGMFIISDLSGKQLLKVELNGQAPEYVVGQGLPAGCYLAQLSMDGKILPAKKIIVNGQ